MRNQGYDAVRRDYPAERVAQWILRGGEAEEDPRTLTIWARSAAVSVRALQYGCFSIGVAPAACRDLARVVRLLAGLAAGSKWDPSLFLNADPRTVRRLLTRAGLTSRRPPESVHAFLSRQAIVESARLITALMNQYSSEGGGLWRGFAAASNKARAIRERRTPVPIDTAPNSPWKAEP